MFTVTGNQPKLQDEPLQISWEHVPSGHRSMETKNGRRGISTVKCVTVTTMFSFSHAAQALQVTRKSQAIGATKWHVETVHV